MTADCFIHPSAFVDPGAQIGEGTKVWHFCHIMPGARIGSQCSLGQNVFVADRVQVGDEVKIQNNVSLYEGVTLEDHVFCGPSMVFTNVHNPRSEVRRMDELRPTLVRRGATLGANCTLVCGVTIGRYAFVGAGAVVTRDVPDYALVTGVPARMAGWVSRAGAALHFDGDRAPEQSLDRRLARMCRSRVALRRRPRPLSANRRCLLARVQRLNRAHGVTTI